MDQDRPGFFPNRLVRLIRQAIDRCRLDLTGRVVLTEAATGAYVVTTIIAVMAGASRVYAIAKSTRYGSKAEVIHQTNALSRLIKGAKSKILIRDGITRRMLAQSDIVTNSGHVRPLNAKLVEWMKPDAVIPLMYETWEFRDGDVDLEACKQKGIRVVGTNEQHAQIDVLGYLGVMAIKQLVDAGVSVYKSRILLISDNSFSGYIHNALSQVGALLHETSSLNRKIINHDYDAILVAMTPREGFSLSADEVRNLARFYPGAIIVQFYGDVDRAACINFNVPIWPPRAPGKGHMGILPSSIGPESIIRLQTGGFKAAQAALNSSRADLADYAQVITSRTR